MTEQAGRAALRKMEENMRGVSTDDDALFYLAGLVEGHLDNRNVSARSEALVVEIKNFPATIRSIASYVEGLEAERTRMRDALKDAHAQIGYLHDKFEKTGSGNAVIARITAALTGRPNDEKGRT